MAYHMMDAFTGKPTIYLYDSVPEGIGLSDRVFEMNQELPEHAAGLLPSCKCINGFFGLRGMVLNLCAYRF